MNGATQPARLKAACKAMEGIFASQIMSELGKGMGGTDGSQQSGLYQDFIQQAMTQQVTAGGGFGLAADAGKITYPTASRICMA